jgi:hypothetical protein
LQAIQGSKIGAMLWLFVLIHDNIFFLKLDISQHYILLRGYFTCLVGRRQDNQLIEEKVYILKFSSECCGWNATVAELMFQIVVVLV